MVEVTLDMLYGAQKALTGVAMMTPLFAAAKIGPGVYVKSENQQLTGSFKLRGAYYKMESLTKEEAEKGVIACSAGNHAQGVALSATSKGIVSHICIPAGAPLSKVEATKNYGGDVILVPGVFDDAFAECMRLVKEKGYTLVHPFNDPYVIAGQGTVGLEILQQLPDVDVVIVPIGGGGLISGVAFAIKSLKPECKVIGVQAEGAPSMLQSRKSGKPIKLDNVSTIADGIAVKEPGDLTYAMCEKYVDEIVTVSEDEIATAILALMEGHKTVAEGAGATTVAACMSGKVDVTGKKAVCIVSGGNIDVNTLSRVITKGLASQGRITELETMVVDKPGELIKLLTVAAQTGANVLKIHHDRENPASQVGNCIVKLVLESRDLKHREEIYAALQANGFQLL